MLHFVLDVQILCTDIQSDTKLVEMTTLFLTGVAAPNQEKLPNKNPLMMIEEEQKEHVAKLSKMEREMEEVSRQFLYFFI